MNKTIMIVDDDTVIRLLLTEYLESLGYTVQAFEAGHAAIGSKTAADLLILDLQMPDMDGIALLKELRQSDLHKNTPAILLSANNDAEKMVESSGVAVQAIIKKPFEMEAIKGQIQELLK